MKVFYFVFRFFLLNPVQPRPLDRNLQRETSSSDMDRDGQDEDVMKMVDKMIVELDQTSTREKHFVSLFGRLDDCQSLGRVRYSQG